MAAALLHFRDEKHKVVAAYAGLAGLSGVVLVRDPLHNTVFPPCPLHSFTGLWCPGCGATRASGLLLRGHPLEAMHYNVMWVIAAPFVAYALFAWGANAFGWRVPRLPSGRLMSGGVLAALLVFFVVRNLPGFGFLDPVLGG